MCDVVSRDPAPKSGMLLLHAFINGMGSIETTVANVELMIPTEAIAKLPVPSAAMVIKTITRKTRIWKAEEDFNLFHKAWKRKLNYSGVSCRTTNQTNLLRGVQPWVAHQNRSAGAFLNNFTVIVAKRRNLTCSCRQRNTCSIRR